MTSLKILLISLVLFSSARRENIIAKEDIKRTFRATGEKPITRILVDNIRGSIDITGYDGDEITLVAHKSIKAESKEKIQEAQEDVKLEIRQERDRLILYVDAPWRTEHGINYHGWKFYGYDVGIDFELKVPRRLNVFLNTVNEGEITVKEIEGDFDIQNVNGGIEATNLSGSGKACTVNGPVRVSFVRNPAADCSFKTVNGKIEVTLLENLSADLRLKTMNGKAYTDFDVTSVPFEPAVMERGRHKKTYRWGDSFTVKVRDGGPKLSFETLNGNIHILKQK